MAMVRSALGKISRRLSGSSAVICQAPPLPSLHPAAQLMTTAFSSPAAAAAARVRRIPNLQGLQHPPFICKGTERMQWAGQKRFFSVEAKAKDAKLMESARSSVKRLMAWMNEQANPRNTAIVLTIINVVYLGIFIRECLRSDEHAKDCTADDNGDHNIYNTNYGLGHKGPQCRHALVPEFVHTLRFG
ncbi:Os07g0119100 [Oryza sativa Japonica Group]|uniref:Os07g0119100 protein n=1 Tax=Oryza sativa subsp. japonica TaxID=39947 RepID=Q0D8Z0_ORYSJ|nr:Os07g0119100 [Oryza sativa Japonica Group]|eukprot:NP_001058769.2 Os07g0119100 [Oryza sativa Japonica Group]